MRENLRKVKEVTRMLWIYPNTNHFTGLLVFTSTLTKLRNVSIFKSYCWESLQDQIQVLIKCYYVIIHVWQVWWLNGLHNRLL